MKRCSALLLGLFLCAMPVLALEEIRVGVELQPYAPYSEVVEGEYRGYARDLLDAFAAESVELGYACTIHGAQGVTADVLHGIATGAETRQQLYTMLTRGRHANHAWLQVDTTDTHTWSVNNGGKGSYGSFSVDGSGNWTYNLDNANKDVQALKTGESITESFTVTVDDGHGGKVKTIALEQGKPGKMSKEEYDKATADLVSYLVWMGEPMAETRKTIGTVVLAFLGLLFVLSYLLKKNYWKDIH